MVAALEGGCAWGVQPLPSWGGARAGPQRGAPALPIGCSEVAGQPCATHHAGMIRKAGAAGPSDPCPLTPLSEMPLHSQRQELHPLSRPLRGRFALSTATLFSPRLTCAPCCRLNQCSLPDAHGWWMVCFASSFYIFEDLGLFSLPFPRPSIPPSPGQSGGHRSGVRGSVSVGVLLCSLG